MGFQVIEPRCPKLSCLKLYCLKGCRAETLFYFLLRFPCSLSLCHVGPAKCQGPHLDILYLEKPFMYAHLRPIAWRRASSPPSCPASWEGTAATEMAIHSPATILLLCGTRLPNCSHTFNCILFCQGPEEMGWDRYYYLHLGEETKEPKREGIITVNICGTLMCQEVLFPGGFREVDMIISSTLELRLFRRTEVDSPC